MTSVFACFNVEPKSLLVNLLQFWEKEKSQRSSQILSLKILEETDSSLNVIGNNERKSDFRKFENSEFDFQNTNVEVLTPSPKRYLIDNLIT